MSSEMLVVASLLQYPTLYDEFSLSEDMFENQTWKKCIRYFNEQGRSNPKELYARANSTTDNFISSVTIRELLDENLISKYLFNQYQQEVLEAYKFKKRCEVMDNYQRSPTIQNKKHLDVVFRDMDSLFIKQKDGKRDTLLGVMEDITGEGNQAIYKTQFDNLNKLIDGFQPSQLNLIGARPSAGKTAFAINMGLHFATKGCAVTFVSLETTEKKITQRILSSLARVPLNKIKNSDYLTNSDVDNITNQMGAYEQMDFKVIDDNNITVQRIRNIIARNKDKQNVVFIDYIQLMKLEGKYKDRRLEIETISRELKILAKETGATIIALAQLSRGVEYRQNKRPMMSDLKEAGGLEQDGDVIMLLYRDDYYTPPETPNEFGKSEIECIVAKNKDGSVGTVYLDFYKPIQRFYDGQDISGY
ncbi:damage-inducible protein [Klebsiella pneumoniae]|nr:damage-inducible protein [Klebsiella pneumoniae]